ncbi:MAG: hypothetical protein LKI17_06285 [Megasphaera cerevisiae]|jgi:hypothetical protein|nr:hypothetical protein [Megasphaera cerevisiae]
MGSAIWGFIGTILGALIGGICSYQGCKHGAKETYNLMEKDKVNRLKYQLWYLADLFDKSTTQAESELDRGQEHIDALVWQRGTLLFDNDYGNELLYARLDTIDNQNVLKWFNLWEKVNEKLNETCTRDRTDTYAGVSFLHDKCPQEKRELTNLIPKIKKIIGILDNYRNIH